MPNARSRPELLLPGHDAWVKDVGAFCVPINRRKRDGTTYNESIPAARYFLKPNGDVTWRPTWRENGIPPPDARQVMDKKKAMAKSGYISMSDSMFYAYHILKRYPRLAEGLAHRYPQIVVDECQDTSDVQHAIISMLVATGKTQVLMIGDPYQAIYEFNDANPQLMLDRIENDHWHEIRLTDNFRSSGKVCDGVSTFFSFGGAMDAKGIHQCCQIDPLVLRYPDKEAGTLPAVFAEITETLSNTCSFKDVKIVTRYNSTVRDLRRLAGSIEHEPNYCTKRLLAAATNRDKAQLPEAFQEAQASLCMLVFGRASLGHNREPLKDMPYRKWRQLVWSAVSVLPVSGTPLSDWISEARESIKQVLADADVHPCHKPSDKIKRPNNCPDIPAEEVVAAGGEGAAGHHIDTVHSVKGQTLAGIMLVARPNSGKSDGSVYSWLPNATGTAPTEEQRIAYVAMTRPAKLLVVAVPESAWKDCSSHFAGFREIKASCISDLGGVCSGCSLAKP